MSPELDPAYIVSDFELEAINASNYVFPDIRVSGCQFHLGRALQRKVKELELLQLYKTNNNVRALIPLFYVDRNYVADTYSVLINNYDFSTELTQIYEYFFNNFIGEDFNAKFPLELWNVSDNHIDAIPRTNNAIKCWHNVFKTTFGALRYNLHLLICNLKDKE
jgi:hypothetical protein